MEKEQEQKTSKNNEPTENTTENEIIENQKNIDIDAEEKKRNYTRRENSRIRR